MTAGRGRGGGSLIYVRYVHWTRRENEKTRMMWVQLARTFPLSIVALAGASEEVACFEAGWAGIDDNGRSLDVPAEASSSLEIFFEGISAT